MLKMFCKLRLLYRRLTDFPHQMRTGGRSWMERSVCAGWVSASTFTRSLEKLRGGCPGGSGRNKAVKGIRTAGLVVALLIALLTNGTAGFHFVQGWSWFKSLYATLMTVSTIGGGPENELNGD